MVIVFCDTVLWKFLLRRWNLFAFLRCFWMPLHLNLILWFYSVWKNFSWSFFYVFDGIFFYKDSVTNRLKLSEKLLERKTQKLRGSVFSQKNLVTLLFKKLGERYHSACIAWKRGEILECKAQDDPEITSWKQNRSHLSWEREENDNLIKEWLIFHGGRSSRIEL